jgi:asparagine synthase (glutamine-hydrolysing)
VVFRVSTGRRHGFGPVCRYFVGIQHLSRFLRIDCALWLEGDILFGVRCSARAAGLQLLLPYADRRLFELAARIPSALKRKDGVEKYILRRAAEARLPRETAFRPKVGFSVPVRSWLRREPFRSRVESVLFGPRSSGLFDQVLLRRYWTSFQSGNDVLWQIPYAAYVLLLWFREFDG